jgi:RNA polymerase sigma factor (sigma-70 family)
MATNGLNRVLTELRRAAAQQEAAVLADGDLLERYIHRRDESAFAALLRRHGPMILGVCRRILSNEADAEDAFQATFLVLVRKADSIRPRAMVSNWLFGVARNTALKAKAMIHKRRAKEKEAVTPSNCSAGEEVWQQVQAVLDEELNRLPEKYRVPILLCELQGKTIKQAARQLGWPQGTVATRLAQGRRMLAKQLSKQGLVFSGGALATVVSQGVTASSLPHGLMVSTLKAATLLASGHATASGMISAKVATLMEGIVKTMFLTKLKIATATALAAVVLGAGASVFCCMTFAAAEPPGGGATRTSTGKEIGGLRKASEDQTQPDLASVSTPSTADGPKYELQVQFIQDGWNATRTATKADEPADIAFEKNHKFRVALPLGVPCKVRISDGGVVLAATKRDHVGIFLRATVLEEKANNVMIETALDDIGLVDEKADIQRLCSFKQSAPLGAVQECTFNPKTMPGRLTIKVTVQRLDEPQPPRPATQPESGTDSVPQKEATQPTRPATQPESGTDSVPQKEATQPSRPATQPESGSDSVPQKEAT